MPLIRPSALVNLTATTNDILANVVQLQNAGPGDYCITPLQNDPCTGASFPAATMTVNDGRANVLSGEPIPAQRAGGGGNGAPNFLQGQKQYFVRCVQGQRLIINVGGTVSGTENKVSIFVEKYA
ncbi:MAG: hypothetical protein FJ303_27240 [Planctomycetes bacterium]|nr:hypothetical protein [Planctomycetota bacterium]